MSWETPAPPQATVDLQRLINDSPDGKTVHIPLGRYTLGQGVLVQGRKNLKIECAPGTQILSRDTDSHVLRMENCENVELANAFLRHVKPLPEYRCHGSVVSVEHSRKITIANCELNGCGAVGVFATSTAALTIRHCYIHHNTWNALYFDSCEEVRIQANVIEDNANTLQMYRMDDVEMSDNVICGNGGYWRTKDLKPGLLNSAPSPSVSPED